MDKPSRRRRSALQQMQRARLLSGILDRWTHDVIGNSVYFIWLTSPKPSKFYQVILHAYGDPIGDGVWEITTMHALPSERGVAKLNLVNYHKVIGYKDPEHTDGINVKNRAEFLQRIVQEGIISSEALAEFEHLRWFMPKTLAQKVPIVEITLGTESKQA